MWPTITAAPTAPGRALRVYHPATATVEGTCSAPDEVSPRRTSPLRTPIDGMTMLAGLATGLICGGGAASWRPGGTGTKVGLVTGAAGRPVLLGRAPPGTPGRPPTR